MTTIAQCLQRSDELLTLSDSAQLDTQLLLAHCLQQSRTYLATWPERELSNEQLALFESLIARRKNGEPIAYLVEQQGFWSLDLQISAATLIPRPETELLVEHALLFLDHGQQSRILDLGTGSGAIALALAKELPNSDVVGVDVDLPSVDLAIANATKNNISNVSFLPGSWYSQVTGVYDLIVSNPPYIAAGDPHLVCGDVRFEPLRALVSGSDGLVDLRVIISSAPIYLKAGGALMVEHGYDQKLAVRQLFEANQFDAIHCHQDLAGQDRITVGIKG
jgi:release factor glutamine methyltransferase